MTSLALLLAAATARPPAPALAHAAQTQRQDIRLVASKIATDVRVMLQGGGGKVRVGEFRAAGGGIDGDTGHAIEFELKALLADLLDQTNGASTVAGSFEYADEPDLPGRVIRVTAAVEDSVSGAVVRKFPSSPILFVHDITRLVGPSGIIGAGGTAAEARSRVAALVRKPAAVVDAGGRAASADKSPFSVEVRVVKGGPAGVRAATLDGGRPAVKLDAGEVYELRVFNRSPQEHVFRVAIDGVDAFAGSAEKLADGTPKLSHFVVPGAKDGKPGEAVVRGRHLRTGSKGEAVFEPFAAGGRAGRGGVGMIGLAFSPSHPENSGHMVAQLVYVAGDAAVLTREADPPTEFLTIRLPR